MRLTICLLLLSVACIAQQPAINKIAASASTANLKTNLYALASKKMEGRIMGSHGDSLASGLVAGWFKQQGIQAPYDNGRSYYQAITAYRYDDKATLTLNGVSYPEIDGWFIYPLLPIKLDNLPVLFNDFVTIEQWNAAINKLNLNGHAVIIDDKLFDNEKRLDSLEGALKAKGAKLILWTGPKVNLSIQRRRQYDLFPHYKQAFKSPEFEGLPEVALSPARMQQLLSNDNITLKTDFSYVNPDKRHFYDLKQPVSVQRTRQIKEEKAPNIIGVIKGTDPEAGSIIISAHHDHDGRRGDTIYYGAVDNASGTAAIMEVAALMNKAVQQGYKPKRSIVFASYTGEERGLLGSYYYSDHPVYPVSKTFAVLNIDMLGRVDTLHTGGKNPDSSYAYILVKDTLNRGLRNALYQANQSVKLTLDTHYEDPKYAPRRIMGSDQYPFYEKGVPFVRIDCGFAKEYHKPEDTPDKIDYNLLTKQTQLVFLTLWNIANK